MHGNSREDTMFAFDENHMDFTTQGYPGRSYSSASSSSSEYWNYTSSSYASSQKHSRHTPSSWSGSSASSIESSSYPRSINSYSSSLRSTDLRPESIYGSNIDLWPPSQLPHWSESNVPDPAVQSWSSMMLPIEACETKPVIHHLPSNACSPLSTISSPSPSPSPVQTLSNSSSKGSRKSGADGAVKMCSHCHATSTPLWRREPSTLRTLCNACGLYLQQRNKLRPQELIDADLDDESESSERDGTGPECTHCHTRNTSVWRRSKTGAQLCNACGVYSRLRGKDRPLSLKRNKIKPRTKHVKPSADKH